MARNFFLPLALWKRIFIHEGIFGGNTLQSAIAVNNCLLVLGPKTPNSRLKNWGVFQFSWGIVHFYQIHAYWFWAPNSRLKNFTAIAEWGVLVWKLLTSSTRFTHKHFRICVVLFSKVCYLLQFWSKIHQFWWNCFGIIISEFFSNTKNF